MSVTKQESVVNEKRTNRRLIAKIARVIFHVLSFLLLFVCIGAWIESFRGAYAYSIDSFSFHPNSVKAKILNERYAQIDLKDGEAIVQVGKNIWNGTINTSISEIKPISFSGGQCDPDLFTILLPKKEWHGFSYEIMRLPPNSSGPSDLGQFYISIAFPLWSAFVVLFVPLLMPRLRRASRRVLKRRQGFAPILKQQLDGTKSNVPDLSREHQ